MLRSSLRIVTQSLVLLVCLVCSEVAQAEPFVPAFDRFGLHQEVDQLLSGALLLTELNCTACHQSENKNLSPKGAPDLRGVGTRLTKNWIKIQILNPNGIKPGTTMPQMLHGYRATERHTPEELKIIPEAIAEFLATQKQNFPELKATGLIPVKHEFWLKGNVENGGRLYHSVGCVACHAADEDYTTEGSQPSSLDKLLEQLDPEELAELGLSGKARTVKPIPHGDLNSKYSLLSLSHFLFDPLKSRPAGRMPSLKLQPTEAADIAAYLLRDQQPQQAENAVPIPEPVDTELAAQGKKFFVEFGCANCHQLPGIEPKQITKNLEDLNFDADRSCLGSPFGQEPLFIFSQEQVDSIRNIAVPSNDGELTKNAHQLTMLQLNCFACHERNDLGGVGRKRQQYFETVGHVDIGDEGRLPPQLTHVGKKLTPSWFKKVLEGNGDIRPHMTIRMPVFPKSKVNELPQQLAIADQVNAASEAEVFGNLTGLAEPGRKLLNTGCIQCHPLRGESLASVVGTDLDGVHERVRPAWFQEFLHNPIALKQRTRMPTFFPNGISSNPDLLDGNVDRQIAAIWTYLKENQKYPLPEKIIEARSKNFELVPTDKPIILRTFMDKAGMHAIAVGFPEKVNFAFDSENCRLVEAWKGRFLDAHGTWYNRFTPLAEPLGTERIDLPYGVVLGVEFSGSDEELERFNNLTKPHFKGYRIDETGTPIFRYDLAGYLIEDRLGPSQSAGLNRKIVIKSPNVERETSELKLTPFFQLLSGKKVEKVNALTFSNENGLVVKIPPKSPLSPQVKGSPDQSAGMFCGSLIPLNSERIEIEVNYKW